MKNKYQKALDRVLGFIPSNFIFSDMDVKGLLQELVDKETPTKPYYNPEWPSGDCSICKTTNIAENLYCRGCGQKIDWGDGYDLIQAGLIEKVQKEEAENETNI